MKMTIRILNKDHVLDYKQACLITRGQEITKCNYPQNETEWWIKQICAGHSTLRFVNFVTIDSIPKSCIMQIIRATKGHPQPEVESSRPDWTGKPRSSDPNENKLFIEKWDAESFLAMCSQRLCYKTEYNTRKVVERWVEEMKKSDIPYIRAIGYCAKPQCKLKGNKCTELDGCGINYYLSDSIIEEYSNENKDL